MPSAINSSGPTNETVIAKCNKGELMGFSKQGTSIAWRRGTTLMLQGIGRLLRSDMPRRFRKLTSRRVDI